MYVQLPNYGYEPPVSRDENEARVFAYPQGLINRVKISGRIVKWRCGATGSERAAGLLAMIKPEIRGSWFDKLTTNGFLKVRAQLEAQITS
jgi:hypothetical protein